MKTILTSALVAVSVLASTASAFAGQTQWSVNAWSNKMQLMNSATRPTEFTSKEARAAACSVSKTFRVGSRTIACGNAVSVKVLGGCGGVVGFNDNAGDHMLICKTAGKFPISIGSLTVVDQSGKQLVY